MFLKRIYVIHDVSGKSEMSHNMLSSAPGAFSGGYKEQHEYHHRDGGEQQEEAASSDA